MKIGYCRNCAMEKESDGSRSSRCRITVQIVLDIIIWLSVSLPVIYLFVNGQPYQTGFFCDDPSLSYPSKDSAVSTHTLLAAGFIVTILLVVLIEVLNCLDNKCRRPCQLTNDMKYCIKSYIVFLIGFLIEEMVVEVVKNKMGVLRPNFFEVCNPHFNKTLCPGYISDYTCKPADDKDLRNSRQSFPSGHSTFSIYTAIYFCIYVENRLNIRFSRLLKIFLQSGLVLIAILCGIGRIKDHKHHPSDVIAGFILGIVVAVFVYAMLWRKLLSSKSDMETQSLQKMDKQCHRCGISDQRGVLECQTPSGVLECQTPSPILQKDYIDLEEHSSSARLIQNNNHGQMSIQKSLQSGNV